ncbi:MAG: carboxymuconolactone decarboxylase family protein [Candidatus Eiseniibacteriota bacterium]
MRRRLLLELAGRGVHAGGSLEPVLRRARRAGLPRRALEELGLMLYLYAGFPAAIEFLRALTLAWPVRVSRSLRRAPRSGSAASYKSWQTWRLRGASLCRAVYGEAYAPLRSFMASLHPDLDLWMIVEGYGKTLSRPGLGLIERELATVAALASLGRPRQLEAHRAGALRVGAPAAQIVIAEHIGRGCRRAGAVGAGVAAGAARA